jgi:FKBP-type peptidyl-prolyl cis-trans isomerase
MQLKPGIKLLSEITGHGAIAEKGVRVKIQTMAWLSKGEPILHDPICEFVVGGRVLIPGIEYAVEGMRVGGTRKVRISPHLGYKKIGVPGIIPGNAVLIYEIELLSVEERALIQPIA